MKDIYIYIVDVYKDKRFALIWWLKPLKGKLGESGFFFNRTWHARLTNESNNKHVVIKVVFSEWKLIR